MPPLFASPGPHDHARVPPCVAHDRSWRRSHGSVRETSHPTKRHPAFRKRLACRTSCDTRHPPCISSVHATSTSHNESDHREKKETEIPSLREFCRLQGKMRNYPERGDALFRMRAILKRNVRHRLSTLRFRKGTAQQPFCSLLRFKVWRMQWLINRMDGLGRSFA